MKLIDSSVLISMFRSSEKNHLDAIDTILEEKDWIILDYVLAEIATVMKLREGYSATRRSLNFLINNDNFHIRPTSTSEYKDNINLIISKKNKLSFVDNLLYFIGRKDHMEVVSYDKDLLRFIKNTNGSLS